MKVLINCLAVGGAGFFGALARYAVSVLYGRLFGGTTFPVATLVINVTGSAFLGWFVTFLGRHYVGPHRQTLHLSIAIGFVGAYTTFSTYMLETVNLAHQELHTFALLYLFGSLALGLAGVEFGMWLGR